MKRMIIPNKYNRDEEVPDDGISIFCSSDDSLHENSDREAEQRPKKQAAGPRRVMKRNGTAQRKDPSSSNDKYSPRRESARVDERRKRKFNSNFQRKDFRAETSYTNAEETESEDDSQHNSNQVKKRKMGNKEIRQDPLKNKEAPVTDRNLIQITAKERGRSISFKNEENKMPPPAAVPVPDKEPEPTKPNASSVTTEQKNPVSYPSRSSQEFMEMRTELEVTKRLFQNETSSLRDQLRRALQDAAYYKSKADINRKEGEIKEELRKHQEAFEKLQEEVKQLHLGRLKIYAEIQTLKENEGTSAKPQNTNRAKKKNWWRGQQGSRNNGVGTRPQRQNRRATHDDGVNTRPRHQNGEGSRDNGVEAQRHNTTTPRRRSTTRFTRDLLQTGAEQQQPGRGEGSTRRNSEKEEVLLNIMNSYKNARY